jgi:hypothetical protein
LGWGVAKRDGLRSPTREYSSECQDDTEHASRDVGRPRLFPNGGGGSGTKASRVSKTGPAGRIARRRGSRPNRRARLKPCAGPSALLEDRPRGRAFPWPGGPHRKAKRPGRLSALDQTLEIVGYEKKQPGEMIPFDIRKFQRPRDATARRHASRRCEPGRRATARGLACAGISLPGQEVKNISLFVC